MGAGTRRGLLLLNLGTPEAPTASAVRRYLREFLSDERVIDLNPVGRWLLLNLFILPFRPSRSAHAYQQIWTDRGSPLMFHSQDLARAVEGLLAGEFEVELAMRYGKPSIEQALERLRARNIEELVVLPLYPQEASSTSGSSLERLYQLVGQRWNVLPVKVALPFYGHPGFLDAFAAVAQRPLAEARADHVLFSFHGLPERHIQKGDEGRGHCLASAGCCEQIGEKNLHCYRAQSFATARLLAQRLGVSADRYSVSFQSRLGRTQWVRPYTDETLKVLASKVRRVAVFCPAFVADCLETLEEIGLRAREAFKQEGGEELVLIPSLNAHPAWVEAVGTLARQAAGMATKQS